MTDNFDQIPFGAAEFAENPEPRCPCLLLLDTSGSMRGNPIKELNEGIIIFKDELSADSLAAKLEEVSIITFGPPTIECEFQTADSFQPPQLQANGDTPMGAAIEMALNKVQERKLAYRQAGIAYYRPWIFLITDGAPTDYWKSAAQKIKLGEESGAFSFFAVGVDGANMDILQQIAVRQPLKLKNMRFRDLFVWLSKSMKNVSRSKPGDKLAIENPATPTGWATL